MRKFIALIVFALCAISVRTTSAGPEPLPGDNKVVLPSEVTVEPVRPWFGIELSGGDGMGTDDGLLTLETFVPIWQNPNHHLFFGFGRAILSHDFDDEGRITNNVDLSSANSTCAECNPISTADIFRNPPINRDRDDVLFSANIGGGYRYYVEEMDRIFGVNAFYDYRDTGLHSFNQIGVGIETLGTCLDFRANGYFVVGDHDKSFGAFVQTKFVKRTVELDRIDFSE